MKATGSLRMENPSLFIAVVISSGFVMNDSIHALVECHEPSPPSEGPYKGIHRIGPATYVIRAVDNGEPAGSGIQMTVHGSRLRPRLTEVPAPVTVLDAPTAMDTSEDISANTRLHSKVWPILRSLTLLLILLKAAKPPPRPLQPSNVAVRAAFDLSTLKSASSLRILDLPHATLCPNESKISAVFQHRRYDHGAEPAVSEGPSGSILLPQPLHASPPLPSSWTRVPLDQREGNSVVPR